MRAYAHIIVERQNDAHWIAWLSDMPQVAAGGEWPAQAIKRLLEILGQDEFQTGEIVAIDEATRVDRLEFRIPLVRRRRLLSWSVN